mgnify:CR=1 FL=1
MEIGILDKSFICVIQPVIKALFGNADMTADSDAVEYTLFYQIICCGTTDTQNVLNLIDRIGSFVIADRILFIKLSRGHEGPFYRNAVQCHDI